ncbi:MAG: hypothetical protein EOQ95_18295 [Mesorhizobium sp.]|nr:MAG: hypothetical protein EOQ95_18295 [Mesorhizobium sp.]
MSLDELRTTLVGLAPGKCAAIHHDICGDLFRPGEPDENARAACYAFAKSVGCRIEKSRARRPTGS